MDYDTRSFRDTVSNDFTHRRNVVEKGFTASVALEVSRSLGHPLFAPLSVGQRQTAPVATVFLDLTNFTARTFWDDAHEVADLAHAILTGFIEVVTKFGGHALGLRGDGLFAGFGPGDEPIDVSLALAACAFALDGVEGEVNPWLRGRGIEPVQARAGVDYGDVTFVRSGTPEHSEVNPIGFAANFAAKCEKTAKSWEVVAGEGAADRLGEASLFTPHSKSPKTYTRNYSEQTYKFYDYRWRHVLPSLPGVLRELDSRPATSIRSTS